VGPDKIYYEQNGKNKRSEITFTNDRQVLNVIERIVAPIGRRIDEKTPYVDARLADGSRVHAIIPPCALDGGTITIRKFPENRLTYKDLVGFGSMTQGMADFLRISVEAHRNIVVSGGTGSGKTTLINMLGGFIPANERIITCEDSAELDFPQDHVVRLETKPPSLEGEGAVDIRCLVKQTLRMKPDRIVVGECRGGETLDMLQAMNTGHDGSMCTVHATDTVNALSRLENLFMFAGMDIPLRAVRQQISTAVNFVIQLEKDIDGNRVVSNITEVCNMEGDTILTQSIAKYTDGEFKFTGIVPKCMAKLNQYGLETNFFIDF
jgi:septum site-determining protein MinD